MQRVDVLFKPDRVAYGVDLNVWGIRERERRGAEYAFVPKHEAVERYDVAVIGAPLWVARSLNEDDDILPSGLRRYQLDTAPTISRWSPPKISEAPRLAPRHEQTRWNPSLPMIIESAPALARDVCWDACDQLLEASFEPNWTPETEAGEELTGESNWFFELEGEAGHDLRAVS